jgi:hypothetical protein
VTTAAFEGSSDDFKAPVTIHQVGTIDAQEELEPAASQAAGANP